MTNASGKALTDVEVRLSMEQYVDAPKLRAAIERLGRGPDAGGAALGAVQRPGALDHRRHKGRRAGDGGLQGRRHCRARRSETITLELYDRNALSWDDDRKVAAFVTAKDDEVPALRQERGFADAGATARRALDATCTWRW